MSAIDFRPDAAMPSASQPSSAPGAASKGAAAIGAREYFGLAIVLLIALAARLPGLNASLWYDEVFTVVNYVHEPVLRLMSDFSSLNNHMFYSLQAKLSVALFGESAWAVRLPALVFGLASLAVIWRIARLMVGPIEALTTVFLLAVSYHHVWFSQNARGYTELLFWTSLATLLLAEGLRRPTWGRWSAYGICVTAAMYTHLSAGFFFLAHAVVYLAAQIARRNGALRDDDVQGLRSWLPLFGVGFAVVLTGLLHAALFSQVLATVGRVSDASAAETGSLAEWRNPLRTLAEVSASLGPLGPIAPIVLVGVIGLVAVGLTSLLRRRAILTSIYLVNVPLTLIVLAAISFRIWPRYFFVDIGIVYLGLTHGFFVVANWIAELKWSRRWLGRRAGALLASLGVIAMVAGSIVLLAKDYRWAKQDFTGAWAFVEKTRAPADRVGAVGLAGYVYQRYYAPQIAPIEDMDDLRAIMSPMGKTYVLVAFPRQTESGRPAVMSALQRDFDLVKTVPGTLGDGAIRVYRSR